MDDESTHIGPGMKETAMLYIQTQLKDTGMAALLAALAGGVGLLYVSTLRGILGTLVEMILFLAFMGEPEAGVLFIPWHALCVISAMGQAKRRNGELLSSL